MSSFSVHDCKNRKQLAAWVEFFSFSKILMFIFICRLSSRYTLHPTPSTTLRKQRISLVCLAAGVTGGDSWVWFLFWNFLICTSGVKPSATAATVNLTHQSSLHLTARPVLFIYKFLLATVSSVPVFSSQFVALRYGLIASKLHEQWSVFIFILLTV